MSYYICKRAFRDTHGPVPAGSIVDPAGLKRFKYRLQEQHIVEITEQNYERYAKYFSIKYAVDIPNPIESLPVAKVII